MSKDPNRLKGDWLCKIIVASVFLLCNFTYPAIRQNFPQYTDRAKLFTPGIKDEVIARIKSIQNKYGVSIEISTDSDSTTVKQPVSNQTNTIQLIFYTRLGIFLVYPTADLKRQKKIFPWDVEFFQSIFINHFPERRFDYSLLRSLEAISKALECNTNWQAAKPCSFVTYESQRPLPPKRDQRRASAIGGGN